MTIAAKISDGVSRRALLTGGLAGGFLLAFHLPVRALAPTEPVQPPDDTTGKFAPNAFIRIDTAGHTTLVMPQVEMGQGIYTGVAMILAEELDADFSSVVLEHAPANEKLYANPAFGIQATGGSTSVRAFWEALRDPRQGQRQDGLRHRRNGSRHEIRNARGVSRIRRQSSKSRRQRRQES